MSMDTIQKDNSMLKVSQITSERTEAGTRLRATVECKGLSIDGATLWFEFPDEYSEYCSESANPWVAALLMPAMRLGKVLKINAPVSPRLLEGANKFMEIMHQWAPEYKQIDIQGEGFCDTSLKGKAIGSFFSGGVDSFYTVLKNRNSNVSEEEKISKLIFIRGFDIGLHDEELYSSSFNAVGSIAKDLGVTLFTCSTNIKEELCDNYANWELCHGLFFLASAYSVEKNWKTIYVPSTHTYLDMFPWGSHPLTDPLINTDGIDVVHDGCEATRVQKVISQIAKSETALKHLRVCWQNLHGKYNCGECEKCIRTKVNLEVAGVLQKCQTFERGINFSSIKKLELITANDRSFMQENYDAAIEMGCSPELIRALKKCLNPGFRRKFKSILWSGIKKMSRPIDKVLPSGRLQKWYRTKRSALKSR